MRRVLALALLLAGPAMAVPPARGTDDELAMRGHEDWITRQHSPTGQYCCDLSDGRIAELRKRDGRWEVLYSKEHWADGTDEWLPIPASAILPQASPLMSPIAWILRGRVYCVAFAGAV